MKRPRDWRNLGTLEETVESPAYGEEHAEK